MENEERYLRQNVQPVQSFGGMKIEGVELEEEVPSRLLAPYYVQELYSCSHILFALLTCQGREEKNGDQASQLVQIT